jgi:molybdopterin synthase catalytic subunit
MHPQEPEKTSVTISDGPLPSGPPDQTAELTTGARLVFEGCVRPLEDGRPIQALDYEVYDGMAERQLQRLAETALQRFAVLRVRVHHSRGIVPVGQCSFRLLIESQHRQEAFDASQWFIDTMKVDVPIWKRAVEVPTQGSTAASCSGADTHVTP